MKRVKMLRVIKLMFSGSSDFAKGTLDEVKDEALSTFRFYKYLFITGTILWLSLVLIGVIALLKVIFGG